ncbi:MAG: hypothetical protein Q7S58_19885 [Candidatus Binatus sp.]|uniref:Vgb family protein n=1 Tax=Candidatus Binatus sp. TaxID=2811406 RepID=UPI00271A590D|nr:hypothetical protein [Candidatus Binatus sp.]MDO8434664.1 hypothetical protein [Candidatus Binatus sp.]
MINRYTLLLGCLFLTFGVLLEARTDPVVTSTGTKLLVVDSANDSVLAFDAAAGAFLGTFIPASSGGLHSAEGLTTGPDNNVYVASWSSSSVKRYDGRTGAFIDDFIAAGSGGLGNPDQVLFGPDGKLYVSDRFASSIRRYDGTTEAFIDTFVSNGGLIGFLSFNFGPDGNIYAGMFNPSHGQNILRFNGITGAFIDVFNSGNPDHDSAVGGLAFGADGNLYACRFHADLVERYNGTTGAYIDDFVPFQLGGLVTPTYLIFGTDHNLNVTGQNSHRVSRYDGATGAFIGDLGAGSALTNPTGLTLAAALPTATPTIALLVGDYNSGKILRYDSSTGAFLGTFAENAELGDPFNSLLAQIAIST